MKMKVSDLQKGSVVWPDKTTDKPIWLQSVDSCGICMDYMAVLLISQT